jgi:peptidyl-prolyl cis-trans isomerase D
VISKSAMTPSFSGRMATMLPGVRPSISLASAPTASTLAAAAGVLLHGHHRRLVADDALALDVDQRVRRPQIDRQIVREHLADKVLEIVRAGVHVTDPEIEDHFRFQSDRVKLRFIRVLRSGFADEVQFDEPALVEFYENNQERFREPERVKIRYLAFRPERFEAQVEPTEEELQIYYDEHRDAYEVGEQVRARHILLRVSPDASEDEKQAVRQRAVDIRKRALEGEDFAELAKEFSEDSTAAVGGDLGAFGRGVMTGPFEAAAFAVEPGQISDLVETQFGIHVIKVEEKLPAGTRTLDEARNEIRTAVQKRGSRKIMLQKVEEAYDKMLDGASFASVAGEYGLEVAESEPFAREELIPGLGRQPKIAEAAFALSVDELGDIANLDDGYAIFQVTERIPSRIPPLEEIRPRVEQSLREERATEAAKQTAGNLLEALRANPDIDAVAAANPGFHVQETGEIGRFGTYVPELGNAPQLKEAAFTLRDDRPVAPEVYTIGGDAVVAVLGERVPAPIEDLEASKDMFVRQLRAQKEAAVVAEFLEELRSDSEIQLGQGYSFAAADS